MKHHTEGGDRLNKQRELQRADSYYQMKLWPERVTVHVH